LILLLPMELSRQIVLVTGSSRGLGSAIAKAFGKQGSRVIVNYNKSQSSALAVTEEINSSSGGNRAIAIKADIRNKTEVLNLFGEADQFFNKKNSITTVINNALIDYKFDPVKMKSIENISYSEFSSQLDGALLGSLNIFQAAIPSMKVEGFGRFINIGTNLFQNPVVPYHDYTASKGALLAFTRTSARELGASGITVNMVSSGLLRTTDASSATSGEVFDLIANSSPLKRVTVPEEVADAVLFFASPWARAITGQNLVVDGGLVMD
jgi:3-oxoacyl-[acyl-carrier protein] reductase